MDKHRNEENLVKRGFQAQVGLNGGLSYVKRWVAAEKDIRISAIDDVGGAFTKKR